MTLTIDVVVAEAQTSPPSLLRIADVVYLAARSDAPERWVSDALIRWPGCLLAAARDSGDRCVIAIRGQEPTWFQVRAGGLACPVLACATAAYWRIVSGQPVSAALGED